MKPIAYLSTLAAGLACLLCTPPARATLADYKAAVTNESSIISYYTFDQSNAVDSRGLHNGAVQGGATFRTGISSGSQGLALDGTGRVNLGTVTDFDFTDTTGTVEAWVRADWSVASYNPCLFADRNGGPVTWSVHMNSDKGAVGMWNGSAYFPTLAIPAPGTNWHHLAVVFESGNLTMYWDGVSLGTLLRSLGISPSSTQIGSSSAATTTEGWIGMFDEVAFYRDALSATAVQAHYAAFFAGTPPVIATQPRGGSYLPGVALRLSVKATGPSLTYQWFKNGGAIAGATDSTLNFASLVSTNAGTYRVVVHNPAADVPSSDAVIAVIDALPPQLVQYQTAVGAEPSLIAYYPFDQLTANTSVGTYNGILMGSADFGQGVDGGPGQGLLLDGAGFVGLVGAGPELDFADTTGSVEAWVRLDWPSPFGSYNPCLVANRDGGLVTWSVHVNADKQGIGVWNGIDYLTLPMPPAGADWHHFAVVFDTGTNTIYWDGLALGSFEQGLGPSPASSVQLGSSTASTATEGWIGLLDEVAFFADALPATAIQAHYRAFLGTSRPVITVQPTGGAFYTGQPFALIVGATGADRTYQWFKDGVSLPGETNWTLVFANPVPTNSGAYFVSVSNAGGTTISATVSVQVGNNLAAYRAAVTNETSLISYYTFDAADAQDSKGTNDGTIVNVANFGPGVGIGSDNALFLDGGGHIALGLVPDFEFANGNGTVEAWIRADWTSDPAYDPCLFANRVASTFQVDWSLHMGRYRDVIGNWNGLFFQALGLPNPVGWHHFAVTFGSDRVAMYWDGLPLGSFAQPIHLTAGLPTQIGSSDPVNSTEGWIGGLDEIAFYRTALGADAILNHFLAMAGAVTAPTITISRSGTQAILSWPASAIGFTLEYSDSLPAASWTPVSGVIGNTHTVDASVGTRFYRLKR